MNEMQKLVHVHALFLTHIGRSLPQVPGRADSIDSLRFFDSIHSSDYSYLAVDRRAIEARVRVVPHKCAMTTEEAEAPAPTTLYRLASADKYDTMNAETDLEAGEGPMRRAPAKRNKSMHEQRVRPFVEDGVEDGFEDAGDRSRRAHSSMGRLLRLAWPEVRLLAFGTFSLLVAVVSQMAMPYLFGELLQHVSSGDSQAAINRTAIHLLIIFSITAIFTTVRGATFTVAGERVVRRLRGQLFDAIQVNEIGFFDAEKTGELTNRLSSDTAVVQNAVTVNVSMGLRFVAQMIVCLIALFII